MAIKQAQQRQEKLMGGREAKDVLYSVARQSDSDDDLELSRYSEENLQPRHARISITKILGMSLVLSFISNCALLVLYFQAKSRIHFCPSEYTGIGFTTKDTYWQSTVYTDPNRTISDEAWEAIDTSPNTVSIDEDYRKKHNLEKSIPFPWDQSKGLYIIKAFHHMHCLKNIRHAYNDVLVSHPGQHQLIPSEHVYHCLDTLRQDIMCRPDDTPMPTTQERHKIGDGQERRCKDWNALVAWTQAPEREACFHMTSDYRRMHTLEQFAFCSEQSRYKSTMENYFAEHGHKPLYLDEDSELENTDEY